MANPALKNYHRETVERSIDISASGAQIWKALLNEENFNAWSAVFKADSRLETNWKAGSNVTFTDGDGNGIVGKIMVHEPEQELSVRFDRILKNGKEEPEDSEKSQKWLGATENFYLTEGQTKSILTVEEEVPVERKMEFESKWDVALEKIKHISESLEGSTSARAV